MSPWTTIALIALGGAIGSNLRFWLGTAVTRLTSLVFPWGTLTVNLSGAFLAGILAIILERWLVRPEWRFLLMTGLLGGFTTFSAYELETLGLWLERRYLLAFAYFLGSVALGFLFVMAGYAITSALFPGRD